MKGGDGRHSHKKVDCIALFDLLVLYRQDKYNYFLCICTDLVSTEIIKCYKSYKLLRRHVLCRLMET